MTILLELSCSLGERGIDLVSSCNGALKHGKRSFANRRVRSIQYRNTERLEQSAEHGDVCTTDRCTWTVGCAHHVEHSHIRAGAHRVFESGKLSVDAAKLDFRKRSAWRWITVYLDPLGSLSCRDDRV